MIRENVHSIYQLDVFYEKVIVYGVSGKTLQHALPSVARGHWSKRGNKPILEQQIGIAMAKSLGLYLVLAQRNVQVKMEWNNIFPDIKIILLRLNMNNLKTFLILSHTLLFPNHQQRICRVMVIAIPTLPSLAHWAVDVQLA